MDLDATAVGVTIGSVFTGAGAWVMNLLKARHDQTREVRRDAMDELFKLNARLEAEIAELKDRADEATAAHGRCEVQSAMMAERIAAMEDALTRANIPFRPWRPGLPPGSDLHRPLPPKETP